MPLSLPPTPAHLPPLSALSLLSLSLLFLSPFSKEEITRPFLLQPCDRQPPQTAALSGFCADGARMAIGRVSWGGGEQEPGPGVAVYRLPIPSSSLLARHHAKRSALSLLGSLVTPGKSGAEKHWVQTLLKISIPNSGPSLPLPIYAKWDFKNETLSERCRHSFPECIRCVWNFLSPFHSAPPLKAKHPSGLSIFLGPPVFFNIQTIAHPSPP